MIRIIENIFSNWVSLFISVLIAFFVSPIIVNTLGKEIYGIWTLIISITGYFTVLDFGVNTAIVRYISSSFAKKDYKLANAIYSTSFVIFFVGCLLLITFSLIFGFYLNDLFNITSISRNYLYLIFLISAFDLALGLLFSVFQGALVGLQEFKFINKVGISVNIIKSILIVIFLKFGGGLFFLAIFQIMATITKAILQYLLINKKYVFLKVDLNNVNKENIKYIYNYSIYSFIIAIALKLLFYTDSIVIGIRIGVVEVAFYSIPSTLLDYMEKFVWAMVAVLVPIISANQAQGTHEKNIKLYIIGTQYSLLLSIPFVLSLYFYGDDFIRLWMGPEFGKRCLWVLRFLLIGFSFSFSQLIAHGILKGISKHKVLAYILLIEAIVNFLISFLLARPYGIEGVAIGTMIPLIIASLVIIYYTCIILSLRLIYYIYKAYTGAIIGIISANIIVNYIGHEVTSYFDLIAHSALISTIFILTAIPFMINYDFFNKIKLKFFNKSKK